MRRLVVPVDLGGSPHRCALSPPQSPSPGPDLVAALVQHYTTERAPAEPHRVEVAFFRGGVPGEALLDACAPFAVRLACSPGDLAPEAARRLRLRGLDTVELEALTLDTAVLRDLRRGYAGRRVVEMVQGLRTMGLRTGVTLAPGLPGSTHASAVADARALVEQARPDFARVAPALAFEGSQLARWAVEGRWVPMDLGQAVTTVLAVVEVLEEAEVPVVRVGLQPGQDVPHRLAAGPWHPSLRGLMEVRRFRARMERALAAMPRGHRAVVLVHPKDLSWAKGTANENVRALRARLGLKTLQIVADAQVRRGTVEVA